ncbi:MAG: hypothetical protein ABF695_12390 [Liquorilactobacillus ghanensis]|uniref:helix-turn-helix transcriptional regulator n=1 Tax=Liquorilactobacillus ghanensis TaxID=399370 RepID=UPI0039ED4EAC
MENTTTIYNKNLETVQDRIDHVAASLNAETINRRMRELVKSGVTMAENGLGKHLSEIANYVLEAKDIKTNRKIERSYYKSEKDYSRYKQAKTALVDDQSKLDYLADNHIADTEDPVTSEYVRRLAANLDGQAVQNWISKLSQNLHNMSREMVIVLMEIVDAAKTTGTEKEFEVFRCRMEGHTAAETAKIRNISVHQAQKQYKNICDKIAVYMREK